MTSRPRRLLRRLLQVVALLARARARGAAGARPRRGARPARATRRPAGWPSAVALEALSCGSYVLMFRPVFCRADVVADELRRSRWSELAAGSLVPASGAGGLALGAWILHRGGMPADRIARRSVAFFLIKSSVNFVAVAVLGTLMAVGLVGPHLSLLLDRAARGAVRRGDRARAGDPAAGPGRDARPGRLEAGAARSSPPGGPSSAARAEAVEILRSRDLPVIAGAIGYWAFDNAVLWATFEAVGADVPISIVLMGYLIGQLGGLLPLPGGVGGIDGGLIGTLIVYGAPAAPTAAAVLAYRVILFWLPLVGGAIAFAFLRRALDRAERPDLCQPIPAT